LTLPLLVTAPVVDHCREALSEAGTEGLHHRGRYLLRDQLDVHRDGRGARTVEALGCSGIGSSTATWTSRSPGKAERYTMALRNLLFT
jgi:hypothetical protein